MILCIAERSRNIMAASRLQVNSEVRRGTLKGRGTAVNPPNRFERARVDAFDDGWDLPEDSARQTADHADPRRHAQHHLPQRQPGYCLRAKREPVPGLRAWLHLLFRPPQPRLSWLFRRARFRDEDRLQARGTAPAGEGTLPRQLQAQRYCAGLEYRPVPAGGAHAGAHPRRPGGAGAVQTTRSASSPNPPGYCAMPIFCHAWRRGIWPR